MPRLARDPFRFGGEGSSASRVGTPRTAVPRSSSVVAPAPPSAPAVRLVGFVRADGRLRAALAIGGEVVVAGPGESAEGYTVVGVDEESGVTLRGPGGAESTLAPPP